MIIAAIFASFFVASMVYGYFTQVYGSFWLAVLWYFLGFILLIIARCVMCVSNMIEVEAAATSVRSSRSSRRSTARKSKRSARRRR